MTREQAIDAIRYLSGKVQSEFCCTDQQCAEQQLKCVQIIEALAPDLLDESERKMLG